MRLALSTPIWLLLLLHLSAGSASCAFSLIDLEPDAQWEFASVWRARLSERDFTSLADFAEGSERFAVWSGIYQLTFRPDRSSDLALTAMRSGASGRIDTTHHGSPPLRRIIEFHEAEWRSIDLSAGRRWSTSSNGASWRLGMDVSLCNLPDACAPRIAGGQISFAQASDPLVWRAALSVRRTVLSLSGGVEVVISPALAIGTNVGISRLPHDGGLAAWWGESFTVHLGKERYVSLELGLDLLNYEPSLTLGIYLPLGGG